MMKNAKDCPVDLDKCSMSSEEFGLVLEWLVSDFRKFSEGQKDIPSCGSKPLSVGEGVIMLYWDYSKDKECCSVVYHLNFCDTIEDARKQGCFLKAFGRDFPQVVQTMKDSNRIALTFGLESSFPKALFWKDEQQRDPAEIELSKNCWRQMVCAFTSQEQYIDKAEGHTAKTFKIAEEVKGMTYHHITMDGIKMNPDALKSGATGAKKDRAESLSFGK